MPTRTYSTQTKTLQSGSKDTFTRLLRTSEDSRNWNVNTNVIFYSIVLLIVHPEVWYADSAATFSYLNPVFVVSN